MLCLVLIKVISMMGPYESNVLITIYHNSNGEKDYKNKWNSSCLRLLALFKHLIQKHGQVQLLYKSIWVLIQLVALVNGNITDVIGSEKWHLLLFSNSHECYHRIVMQTLWFYEIFCITGWLAIAFAKVSLLLLSFPTIYK